MTGSAVTGNARRVRLPHGGELAGRTVGNAVAYLGVPYAAPPVGPLRFRAPRPAFGWSGIREAVRPGPIAPQTSSRLEGVLGPQQPLAQSEDCLTVNVWAPAGADPPRPVLVFLHGGGFLTGGGGLDWYDGAALAAAGDLVVVTVNYRQGVLGFGRLPDGSANNGLRDVLLALRWVRDNVPAFGGDPERVTVSGQSGGAFSILALLGSGAAAGLVRQVVLQSTPAGMAPHTAEQADRSTALVAEELGADDREALLTAPVADLLDAQARVLPRLRAEDPDGVAPPFIPVEDGELVPSDLVGAAAARIGGGMRAVLGTTRDEGTAFFDDPATARRATDRFFREPIHDLAGRLAARGDPPHVYRVDWCPASSPFGATHCIELPFEWGTAAAWTGAPMLAGADPDDLDAMTALVQRCWSAFAHGHEPHPHWPRWPALFRLDATPTAEEPG